jgi:predicted ribosome quality control (RQC) complex YloA/Tae2 family protein
VRALAQLLKGNLDLHESVDVARRQVKKAAVVQQIRKPYWFEKFNWFISRCARPLAGYEKSKTHYGMRFKCS